jgi:hypothetical protein
MGCCASDVDFDRLWDKHNRAFGALHLEKSDVKVLWGIFQKADLGESGTCLGTQQHVSQCHYSCEAL